MGADARWSSAAPLHARGSPAILDPLTPESSSQHPQRPAEVFHAFIELAVPEHRTPRTDHGAPHASAADEPRPSEAEGVLPSDAKGRPLNLDFETGTLQDWTAEGEAFAGQPIKGDTVLAARPDMKSRHAGKFWIGGLRAQRATSRRGR